MFKSEEDGVLQKVVFYNNNKILLYVPTLSLPHQTPWKPAILPEFIKKQLYILLVKVSP
jgi:hypothetical protein